MPEPDIAWEIAHFCLMDTLACAFQALDHAECSRLLGAIEPGEMLAGGARVPGTPYELTPAQAAARISAIIRLAGSNDTGLTNDWGHLSDNLVEILTVADYRSRQAHMSGGHAVRIHDVLEDLIKAQEIEVVSASDEGIELLEKRFAESLAPRLTEKQWSALSELFADRQSLAATPVDDFMALLVA